jgi:predicted RNA methylase
MPRSDYQPYWDENIEQWAELYLDISHGQETYDAPPWFSKLYASTLGRVERNLMKQRYAQTVLFLDKYLKPGLTMSDIGCGTGIFVIEALKRGARINAIDFAPRALEITRTNVARHFPSAAVDYYQIDVQRQQLPLSDVAVAMGVTPYLSDLTSFLANALPTTKLFYCLYVDGNHWANRLRSGLPFLNVRGLRFCSREQIDNFYRRHRYRLLERTNFATGFIDLAAPAPSSS